LIIELSENDPEPFVVHIRDEYPEADEFIIGNVSFSQIFSSGPEFAIGLEVIVISISSSEYPEQGEILFATSFSLTEPFTISSALGV